jgi:hypothetical protein
MDETKVSLQNIGIRKGESLALISCVNCDVDNECEAANTKPNANGFFLPDFVYKIECEGCGLDVAFAVIEL